MTGGNGLLPVIITAVVKGFFKKNQRSVLDAVPFLILECKSLARTLLLWDKLSPLVNIVCNLLLDSETQEKEDLSKQFSVTSKVSFTKASILSTTLGLCYVA